MIRVEQSIVINRPLAEVFAFAADPANDSRWNEPIIATRLLTAGPVGAGAVFQHTVCFLGRRFETTVEVTAYEPNARACVRTIGGPLRSTGCRLFEAAGEGATRLTITVSGEAVGLFRLAAALAAPAVERQLAHAVARLKALLEQGA